MTLATTIVNGLPDTSTTMEIRHPQLLLERDTAGEALLPAKARSTAEEPKEITDFLVLEVQIRQA
jgi:hypothetical protein